MWFWHKCLIRKQPCTFYHLCKRLEKRRGLHRTEHVLASSGMQSSSSSNNREFCNSQFVMKISSYNATEYERNSTQDVIVSNIRDGMGSGDTEMLETKRPKHEVRMEIKRFKDGEHMKDVVNVESVENKGSKDYDHMKDGLSMESLEIKTSTDRNHMLEEVSRESMEIKRSIDDDHMKDELCLECIESTRSKDDDHTKDGLRMESKRSKDEGGMESELNMDDIGLDKVLLQPLDLKIVQDICNYLDGRPWNDATESFLEEKYGLQISHLVVARVILKQRKISIVVPFFRWASKQIGRDIHSSHAYLLKLGELKHFDKMWAHLDEMKGSGCQVKGTAFCILIKAYGASRMPAMAVDAFKRMGEYNVQAETHVYTTLLSVFFLSQLVDEARLCYSRILQEGLCLDVSAFSTLIRGFGMSSYIRDAQSCFNMMVNEGYEPDVSTCNGLIEGFFQINAVKDAMSTFSDLQKRGLKPNVSTFNIIIKAYCRLGRLEEAIHTFASMKKICLPNQSTFNILLQGLLSGEDISKAINFFRLMENEGWVDARSYIYLCNGLRQAKQTQEMLNLLKSLFAKHGFTNIEVCNALIHNLSLVGRIEEAEEIFKGMVSVDATIPSYAIMIKSHCSLGNIVKAEKLLSELKMQGGKPSAFCYTPIISSLLKANKPVEAMKYLEEMMNCGLGADAIVYDLLLKALCRQAEVADALKICNIVIENRFSIGIATLFDLMKCLSKLGRVKEANDYFRVMYKRECLPKVKAISQAMGVIELMSPTF